MLALKQRYTVPEVPTTPPEPAIKFISRKNDDLKKYIDTHNYTINPKSKDECRERSIELDRAFSARSLKCVIDKKIQVGATSKDLNICYESLSSRTLTSNSKSLLLHKESRSDKLSTDVEERIHSYLQKMMHTSYLRQFVTRIDKELDIEDQIKESPDTFQMARKIIDDLRIDNIKRVGLDSYHFKLYKNTMRSVKSSLELLKDHLLSFPCNFSCDNVTFIPCDNYVSKEGYVFKLGHRGIGLYSETNEKSEQVSSTRFDQLFFVEKTVIIYRKFKNINSNVDSLISIPSWCEDCTDEEKEEKRKSYFPKIENSRTMRCKDLIGVFCLCVYHYSREEKWKQKLINRILTRECPCLSRFWHTTTSGAWMTSDIEGLVHSMGLKLTFTLDPDDILFSRSYASEFGAEKRKAVCELFDDILDDTNIFSRSLESMQIATIAEPGCVIGTQESCEEHQCAHCEKYNTFFVTQLQVRSADEPMNVWVKCKECFQITKLDD